MRYSRGCARGCDGCDRCGRVVFGLLRGRGRAVVIIIGFGIRRAVFVAGCRYLRDEARRRCGRGWVFAGTTGARWGVAEAEGAVAVVLRVALTVEVVIGSLMIV